MQTIGEQSRLLFLKLISDVTLTASTEIQIRGKLALVIELLVDIPDTPHGRIKKYVFSNYRSDEPFVPEMGFILLDNKVPGETDHHQLEVLPEWVWDENTADKEVSAMLTHNRTIVVDAVLNQKHCQQAIAWLAGLEKDGFGQSEESI